MESAPCQALYAGSRSNGSQSQETKPNMGGATSMFALLALNIPEPYEMFVVRMRDRPTPHLRDRGSDRNWQREWVVRARIRGVIWFDGWIRVATRNETSEMGRIVNVAEVGEVASNEAGPGRRTQDWNG
ncbi:hypothetical protein EDB85DRAFT_1896041 [Lactarius pseudohatsudake]|nr:hypothetical protein EDB85DRAFT_1896041 [Lactarius pseudohatsudake]